MIPARAPRFAVMQQRRPNTILNRIMAVPHPEIVKREAAWLNWKISLVSRVPAV